MREPTAAEQLLIELINRARLDPVAEAARYGISLDDGLAAGTISSAPKDPLAVNVLLNDAAYRHSLWMIEADVFSHTGAGGSSVGDRVTATGYRWSWVGENLSWVGTTGALGDLGARIEQQHQNLFLSSGHRVNILRPEYVEVGVGQAAGQFTTGGQTYNASMVTETFARSADGARFLTGVVIDDRDDDDFYDIGEGLGGVLVTAAGAAGTFSTLTFASGGYSLAVPDGSYTVTFSGGALGGSVTLSATMAGHNLKIDAEQDDAVASVPRGPTEAADILTGTDGDDEIDALGGDDLVSGGAGDDILRGGNGWDSIWGGAGNDRLWGGAGVDRIWGEDGDDLIGGGAWHDTIWGGAGVDTISGDAGNDLLRGEDGADWLSGGDGNDRIWGGAAIDTLLGGAGDDTLDGGALDDLLDGGDGNDRLLGGLGHDTLAGGDGDDWLEGNGGNDVLAGGAGVNDLTGGLGADRFVFAPTLTLDRVHDFAPGVDGLDFSAVAGVSGLGDLTITQLGGDTAIDLPEGGGRVLLLGVSADALGADGFLF